MDLVKINSRYNAGSYLLSAFLKIGKRLHEVLVFSVKVISPESLEVHEHGKKFRDIIVNAKRSSLDDRYVQLELFVGQNPPRHHVAIRWRQPCSMLDATRDHRKCGVQCFLKPISTLKTRIN